MFKQRGKGKNSSQRKAIFKLKEFFELPGSRDEKKRPLEIPRECSNSKDWPYRQEKLVIDTEQKLRPA